MYDCESWTIKKTEHQRSWCFWTVVLEKTLESPLDSKEIQPVHPKGDHSWVFIERTDAEAETPILRLHDVRNWLLRKDPDAGKVWRQKGRTEKEMVGCYHRLNGHEFEQPLGDGEGQGNLATGSQGVGHNWATEQQQNPLPLNASFQRFFSDEQNAAGVILYTVYMMLCMALEFRGWKGCCPCWLTILTYLPVYSYSLCPSLSRRLLTLREVSLYVMGYSRCTLKRLPGTEKKAPGL